MKEFGETQEPASKIYLNENDRHAFREVATCLTVWEQLEDRSVFGHPLHHMPN